MRRRTSGPSGAPPLTSSSTRLRGEVDERQPRRAVVRHRAVPRRWRRAGRRRSSPTRRSGERFSAVRGEGAWRDGEPLVASGCVEPAAAIVGISGLPDGATAGRSSGALGAVGAGPVPRRRRHVRRLRRHEPRRPWRVGLPRRHADLPGGRRRRRRRPRTRAHRARPRRPPHAGRRGDPRAPRRLLACAGRADALPNRQRPQARLDHLDGAGDAQHGVLAPAAADDLQADRQAGVRRGDGAGRTARTPPGTATRG